MATAGSTLVWYGFFYCNFTRLLFTIIRIHGGSFIVGSATDPGLDGSKLALATNSIVAVIQYRLGTVSFLHSSSRIAVNLFVAWLYGSKQSD